MSMNLQISGFISQRKESKASKKKEKEKKGARLRTEGVMRFQHQGPDGKHLEGNERVG